MLVSNLSAVNDIRIGKVKKNIIGTENSKVSSEVEISGRGLEDLNREVDSGNNEHYRRREINRDKLKDVSF